MPPIAAPPTVPKALPPVKTAPATPPTAAPAAALFCRVDKFEHPLKTMNKPRRVIINDFLQRMITLHI